MAFRFLSNVKLKFKSYQIKKVVSVKNKVMGNTMKGLVFNQKQITLYLKSSMIQFSVLFIWPPKSHLQNSPNIFSNYSKGQAGCWRFTFHLRGEPPSHTRLLKLGSTPHPTLQLTTHCCCYRKPQIWRTQFGQGRCQLVWCENCAGNGTSHKMAAPHNPRTYSFKGTNWRMQPCASLPQSYHSAVGDPMGDLGDPMVAMISYAYGSPKIQAAHTAQRRLDWLHRCCPALARQRATGGRGKADPPSMSQQCCLCSGEWLGRRGKKGGSSRGVWQCNATAALILPFCAQHLSPPAFAKTTEWQDREIPTLAGGWCVLAKGLSCSPGSPTTQCTGNCSRPASCTVILQIITH